MISEYIILYKNANLSKRIWHSDLLQYCWNFLQRRDKQIYTYFQDQFSDTSQKHCKVLALILYCQSRALFRKNSTIYTFNVNDLHVHCLNQARKIPQYKAKRLEKEKAKVYSLRAQLNHIWIPLLHCANKQSQLKMHQISDAETLLTWYARLFCTNKHRNKCVLQINFLIDQIKEYETERLQLASTHLTRTGIGGGYSAEFAQHLINIRTTTKVCTHNFKETANAILRLVSPTAQKLGSTPRIPCGNTLKTMESAIRYSFIADTKSLVFSNNNPCCLSSDAVKKTGCLGVKIRPFRITTYFESFQFAILKYMYLENKHLENALLLSDRLMIECTELQLPQLTFYCGDSAATQTSTWKSLVKSSLPFALFSLFIPDWPHGINTAYTIASEMTSGKEQSYEFRQCLIAFMLSKTKKLIENDESNVNNVLIHYDKDTYYKIITAATTRFLGFTNGIESLLFTRTIYIGCHCHLIYVM